MNEHVAAKAGRATYQDVLDASEHMVAELIKGVLHGRLHRTCGLNRC